MFLPEPERLLYSNILPNYCQHIITPDAVKREVLEETGENYKIDRMLFFHENFFNGLGSLSGL